MPKVSDGSFIIELIKVAQAMEFQETESAHAEVQEVERAQVTDMEAQNNTQES